MRRSLVAAFVCALALTGLTSCTTSASPTPPAAVTSGTAPAPTLSAGQRATVTYCNHEHARITEPASLHGPAPAAVYVHGGSWVSGNYSTGGFLIDMIGPELAQKGFVVVSLDYRLGPKAKWPDQIVDVKCAIRYLRANALQLNIDPNAIGAWGQSAGGHLVGLLGTAGPSAGWDIGAYADESSGVDAVVDMAGPSDLLTLGNQGDSLGVAATFVSLLGPIPRKQVGTDLRAASPVTYIANGDPPFLLMHSTDDEIVYPQQSNEMAWDLEANSVPHQLVIVDGGGHEFDNPGEHPTEAGIAQAIVQFFVRTLVYHEPLDTSPSGGTGSPPTTSTTPATPTTNGSTGTTGSTGSTGTTVSGSG
ncbi:MAG TPA: alpha/beta hydrolase [Acidimicrobiales bacterium]|jgi:acetyl esterase/lipase|nr:alpha/beta hydrolase [Acidimicrobiales bacterium]